MHAADGATLVGTLGGHEGNVYSVACGARLMATGDEYGHVRVWAADTLELVGEMREAHGSSAVFGLVEGEAADLLVSGGLEGHVKRWSIRERACTATLT